MTETEHNLVNLILAWAVAVILLLVLLPGCEVIMHRPPVKTEGMRADNAEKYAIARVLTVQAAYMEEIVLCLQVKYPKQVPSLADAQKECGPMIASPVTVIRTEKTGEVASQFSLIPNGGMGALLGGLMP